MREIKFRQPVYNSDGSFRGWHYWGLFKEADAWVNISPAPRHYAALIKITDPLDSHQFTGLLDKNGKEIYHKDVIRDDDGGKIRIVEWNQSRSQFYLKSNNRYKNFNDCGQSQSDGPVCVDTIEIIGNTYENPNLIP